MNRVTLHTVRQAVAAREPFDCNGTLKGRAGSVYELGQLPQEWRDIYRANKDHIVYTVISYSTPIMWVMDNGNVIAPEVRYSQSTSRHQRAI